MKLSDWIRDNIRVLHKVKNVPNEDNSKGIYFVWNDDFAGLYIVSDKDNKKSVKKIFNSSEWTLLTTFNEFKSYITNIIPTLATKEELQNSTTNNKGIFSTIQALRTLYPDNSTNNKKGFQAFVGTVSPFRKWEIQTDGGAWLDTGQNVSFGDINLSDYATHSDISKKADRIIDKSKVIYDTDILTQTSNKYNSNDKDVATGRFLDTNTGLPTGVNAVYKTTGFIATPAGSTIYTGNNGEVIDSIRFICFYDGSGKYLSYQENVSMGTVPVGAAACRISFAYNNYPAYQIQIDTPITEYIAYVGTIKDSLLPNSVVDAVSITHQLVGKNLFDKADEDLIVGKYLNTDTGLPTNDNPDYYTTGFIKVSDFFGKTLVSNNVNTTYPNGVFRFACFYDEDKNRISGFTNSPNLSINSKNIVYLRTSFNKTAINLDSYKIIIGLKWMDNAILQKSALPEGYDHLITVSEKNIFNPFDPNSKQGMYLGINAELNSNVNYATTGFIPLLEGETLTSVHIRDGGAYQWYYDANFNKLQGIPSSGLKNKITGIVGCAYVRLSLSVVTDMFTQQVQLEYGTEITDYEPHYILSDYFKNTTDVGNDICVPSKLYMLNSTQYDLFFQAITKINKPNDYAVRLSGVALARHLSKVASIANAVDGNTASFGLVELDNLSTLKTVSSTIVVGQKGTGTERMTASIVGDSFTNGGFFIDALIDKGYCPNLKLVGLRKAKGLDGNYRTGQYDEGRGGWTLAKYFTIPTTNTVDFHGYMHPQGNYRYWGTTAFWINAWKVFRGTAGTGFEPAYSCGRYDDYLDKLDEATGVVLNPVIGDIQYYNSRNSFMVYDGTQWVETTQGAYLWEFDYSKYLSMWGLDNPKVLFVMLGVNDFYGYAPNNTNYTAWENQINIFIASYLEAVPDGKFCICIPCSSMGDVDNDAGTFMLRNNRALWNFRNWLIKKFDNRESDSIYLVDTGICTDNEYAYRRQQSDIYTLPFAGYNETSDRLLVQTGVPHPYVGYPVMGLPLAAFIQKYRV